MCCQRKKDGAERKASKEENVETRERLKRSRGTRRKRN
jgi:hypothetical protein